MAVFLTILGIVVVFIGLQDVFHTLFHPAKHGNVSDWIARRIWRLLQRIRPKSLSFAGPVAFVTIMLFWAGCVIIGFSLILLPRLPQAFVFVQGLDTNSYGSWPGALDVSIGSLITLSTGAYSKNLGLQWLMGIEAVIGFALLTAAVSWLLSIYPVFEHRKSLAHEATLIHFSEVTGIRRLDQLSDSDLSYILEGLASQLITCRNELSQFPITYYFHEDETKTALAGILPYLADVAEQSVRRSGSAALAATVLGGAIDDYLNLIARSFLRRPFTDRGEILRAFAADHQREVVRSPRPVLRAARRGVELPGRTPPLHPAGNQFRCLLDGRGHCRYRSWQAHFHHTPSLKNGESG